MNQDIDYERLTDILTRELTEADTLSLEAYTNLLNNGGTQ